MTRCEDFPCCGHELGCCPRFENGVQMDMVCTCGRRLPVDNPVSICNACLRAEDDWAGEEESYDDEESDTADYPDDTPMFDDYYGGE